MLVQRFETVSSGDGLRKKIYGKWVEIEVQTDSDKPRSPNFRMWSTALCEMVYDYIGGETDEDFEVRYNPADHEEAERWIFGDQLNDLSFDQTWRIIFENIDPKLVKERLRLIFKRRFEKYMKKVEFNRKRIKNEIENSLRRRNPSPRSANPAGTNSGGNYRRTWLDDVLRGSNDS